METYHLLVHFNHFKTIPELCFTAVVNLKISSGDVRFAVLIQNIIIFNQMFSDIIVARLSSASRSI